MVHDLLVITPDEVDALLAEGAPLRLLDVRTADAWAADESMARGATRISPDRPVSSAAALALPRHEWLVAYCA